MDPYETLLSDERTQLLARLATHRAGLRGSLDDLTEEEARRRLVPSATTLLGLVRHVTCAELIWSQEAVLGIPRAELGLPASPSDAFLLEPGDTIEAALAAHAEAVTASDEALAPLALDDVVSGHRLGPMTVRWVLLHLVSEMAQHQGHAEILREQVLAAR